MGEIKILYKKETSDKSYIIAISTKDSCKCPSCGAISTAKHSRYTRKIMDGALNGITKEILLIVRKFKCNNDECSQKIFTERLDFVSSYGRKSKQIVEFITLLALTTSAKKVSKIIKKLGIRISNDTVLRMIKELPLRPALDTDKVINIGVDDFALKEGNRYGTIICNLNTKEIIDALPSRTKEDLSKWLQQYPGIKLVSRDGSLSYAAAIAESLPKATQVSDKFHLIKNLLDAVGSYIKRSYPINIPLKDDDVPLNKDAIDSGETEVFKDISDDKSPSESLRQQKIESKRSLINDFKSLFRNSDNSNLEAWIAKVRSMQIQESNSYINGIHKDIDAVKNSMISRYTNGLLEGTINKVKVIKRISYGRCNFSLLRAKILHA